MKKVLILYFSGVGSTKRVAELLHHSLIGLHRCIAEISSLEEERGYQWSAYDALIIGTPVYHAAPARIVMDFFDRIAPLEKAMPAFLYNTRALWSCNTNRILAKKILSKNIQTIMDREYRTPASDGVLIAPFVRSFFSFERNLHQKIESDCNRFLTLLEESALQPSLPRFHFSSIVNAPNKLAGQHSSFRIYVHNNRCVRCGKCIEHCPHHAISKGNAGDPVFGVDKCGNCYRCIHHCPVKALSLSKHKTPIEVLNFENLR